MSAYSDEFREEIVALRDEVVGDLQADGLIFAEKAVFLITVTTTGADPAAGDPGVEDEEQRELVPRPTVDARRQVRWRNGSPIEVGDALLVISRGACTREELDAAAFIDVGADRYRLCPGEVKETPFTFRVIVAKEAR